MLIFIDSNIFYNNWHLNNANFKNFLSIIEFTKSTVLLSEIVCSEVDAKYDSEFQNLQKSFNHNLSRVELFLNRRPSFDLDQLKYTYSLKTVIQSKTNRTILVHYNDVSNSVIVERAINRVKPFQENEKGYRDTLIWLSFLEFLKKSGDLNDIAFISNNANDFYNKDNTDFHADLKKDINQLEIKNNFQIFTTLNNFNGKYSSEIHKNLSSEEVLDKYIYPNERIIESELENFINTQTTEWFIDLLRKTSVDFKDIEYVLSHDFKIYEGIEDPELYNWTFLNDETIFTELSFSLRIVNLKLVIPRSIYNQNIQYLRKKFPDIKNSKETVTIHTFRKVAANISFNIFIDTDFIDDIEINEFNIK